MVYCGSCGTKYEDGMRVLPVLRRADRLKTGSGLSGRSIYRLSNAFGQRGSGKG